MEKKYNNMKRISNFRNGRKLKEIHFYKVVKNGTYGPPTLSDLQVTGPTSALRGVEAAQDLARGADGVHRPALHEPPRCGQKSDFELGLPKFVSPSVTTESE